MTTPRNRWMHVITPTNRLARLGDRNPESGAILILAMIFLTVILTLTVSVLTLAQAGTSSLRSYRLERTRRYAADSALEAAVQMVKDSPTMGVTGFATGTCMTIPIREDTVSGLVRSVVGSGTPVVIVTCGPTPGVSSGGVDTDGGQLARDVTFEVECRTSAASTNYTKIDCASSGSTTRVLARARVRYDIDYGITPTSPNCNAGCNASTVRAVVPKVVYWSIKG